MNVYLALLYLMSLKMNWFEKAREMKKVLIFLLVSIFFA